ncbi:NAD-dependent epimerase/dehydratase family protein [Candidatus Uhrbacteria bacterium]|nr:NAD-dependent epimerase/dehydratase family protein [Candidatus Uhrbacteria bacterium]
MSDKPFEKKNVLVTGGAGFIGSHLCERLLRDGVHVICLDNFSTSSIRNIEPLLSYPDFHFLRLDANLPLDLEKIAELEPLKLPFQGIQEIYHLACPMAIQKFDQFRIQILLANSLANYHILELALKYRSKVLLSSSAVVYGPRREGHVLLREDAEGCVNHLSPRGCYDEGRRFSETMFETYRAVHGIDAKIARVFRTYGPRMPLFDGHLIPDFVLNALEGKDLVIYGHEDFRTSLVYVDDVVDGLIRVMQAPTGTGPVNIGSDADLRMADIAQRVIDLTGSSSRVVFQEGLLFLSELGLPDTGKARELGWLPLTRLEDGLQKTIDDIRATKILSRPL